MVQYWFMSHCYCITQYCFFLIYNYQTRKNCPAWQSYHPSSWQNDLSTCHLFYSIYFSFLMCPEQGLLAVLMSLRWLSFCCSFLSTASFHVSKKLNHVLEDAFFVSIRWFVHHVSIILNICLVCLFYLFLLFPYWCKNKSFEVKEMHLPCSKWSGFRSLFCFCCQ